jgi:hypothetical protein
VVFQITARSLFRQSFAASTSRMAPLLFLAQATILSLAEVTAQATDAIVATTTHSPPTINVRRSIRDPIFIALPLIMAPYAI